MCSIWNTVWLYKHKLSVITELLEATSHLLTFLMPTFNVYSTYCRSCLHIIYNIAIIIFIASPLDLAAVAAATDSSANLSALFQQL